MPRRQTTPTTPSTPPPGAPLKMPQRGDAVTDAPATAPERDAQAAAVMLLGRAPYGHTVRAEHRSIECQSCSASGTIAPTARGWVARGAITAACADPFASVLARPEHCPRVADGEPPIVGTIGIVDAAIVAAGIGAEHRPTVRLALLGYDADAIASTVRISRAAVDASLASAMAAAGCDSIATLAARVFAAKGVA